MSRVAAGDAEAFAQLFRCRQGVVYRFVLHMTASPSIAEDVTQDVFLTVMSEAARYDPARAAVSAWLCGIARNHVRRRAERDRLLQPLIDDEAGAEMEHCRSGVDGRRRHARRPDAGRERRGVAPGGAHAASPLPRGRRAVRFAGDELRGCRRRGWLRGGHDAIATAPWAGAARRQADRPGSRREAVSTEDAVFAPCRGPSRTIPNDTAKIGRSLRSARNLA